MWRYSVATTICLMVLTSEGVSCSETAYMTFDGRKMPLTFNLAEPIILADSHTSPGIQLADVVAAATGYALGHPQDPTSRGWLELLEPRIGETSVVTDLQQFAPDGRNGFIGTLLLQELVDRSLKGRSVCQGIGGFIIACQAAYPEHRATRAGSDHENDET